MRCILGAYPDYGGIMVWFFVSAISLSSFLLFCIQPMAGKMVLPLLGGTPAVWNTCLVFFQAVLLGGYLYAHVTSFYLSMRMQIAIHLGLLCLAFFLLPIQFGNASVPSDSQSPLFWLLYILTLHIGFPFFLLSSSAPLLQRWYHYSGHEQARDPYFLYAGSNIGSLFALLSYPIVIEPFLHVADQSETWRIGYAVLLGLFLVCGFWVGRRNGHENNAPDAVEETPAPKTKDRVRWLMLSFAPSCLLLTVTQYITRDIAPVPLLWVIPLALYMGSFVIVFSRFSLISHHWMRRCQMFLFFPPLLLYMMPGKNDIWMDLPVQLLALGVHFLVCHGELARSRPHPYRLTEFYLLMSLGGVLGGLFVMLVAPLLFTSTLEYPLTFLLIMALRPTDTTKRFAPAKKIVFGFLCCMIALILSWQLATDLRIMLNAFTVIMLVASGLLGWLLICAQWRPAILSAGVGFVLLLLSYGFAPDLLFSGRNFFGTVQVKHIANRELNFLIHGSTMHGVQSTHPSLQNVPMAYYHFSGPFGDIDSMVRRTPGTKRVGIVGLGVGTQLMYGQDGDHFTYFEIDSLVVSIAKEKQWFTYLHEGKADWDIVMGDARFSLQTQPDAQFDLLVVDAFSSDSIPVHLLTREALRVYLSKLKPGGCIAFHVTNHYLDLPQVLAALARDAAIPAYLKTDNHHASMISKTYISSSVWAVFFKDGQMVDQLPNREEWKNLAEEKPIPVWTDDYSNVLRVIKLFQ
jgi:SAM-dependent methyltransferase